MNLVPQAVEYARAFDAERARAYPIIDTLESDYGYALGRPKLEAAARVLACPVKVNPPNWQHGRMLYTIGRHVCASANGPVMLLDIGTAKGFSALCLEWARLDADVAGLVVSVDVIDPDAHTRRNTVAECDGPKSLGEVLAPWPEAQAIEFRHDTGLHWLTETRGRVHLAYIDGKHDYGVVRAEGMQLAARQTSGDIAIFDDLQIEGVARAVKDLAPCYDLTRIDVLPTRAYGIGIRR